MQSDNDLPVDSSLAGPTAPNNGSVSAGWGVIRSSIQLRMRFVFVLLALATLATGWPWLTNVWERVVARLNPYKMDSTVAAGTDYFCPMDPGVVSDWPAICPVCNMDLIRRKKSDSQLLPSGVLARMQISPYRVALAGIRTVTVEPVPNESSNIASTTEQASQQEVVVPGTSVVHWESETIAYVESMAGMFDAVPIELSRREGENCIVKSGLKPGQKVVAVGTLLVDAESRLHPHLSTQYFGAAAQVSSAPPKPVPRSNRRSTEPLNEADFALIEAQRYCPVTQAKLGSMGSPVFVEVVGRRIAMCCEGCRDRLLADPVRYLTWLDERLANEQVPK